MHISCRRTSCICIRSRTLQTHEKKQNIFQSKRIHCIYKLTIFSSCSQLAVSSIQLPRQQVLLFTKRFSRGNAVNTSTSFTTYHYKITSWNAGAEKTFTNYAQGFYLHSFSFCLSVSLIRNDFPYKSQFVSHILVNVTNLSKSYKS